jgi:hypothetical protein
MRVVTSQMPAARPQLDANFACAVLADKSCKIAVMQHCSRNAGVDREQVVARGGVDAVVVDCGDADLLIT